MNNKEENRMHQTTRIIVMAKNKVGVIAGITGVLAEGNVNISSLNTQTQGDTGTITLTTDQTNHALALLNSAGYKAVCDDTLIVQLSDEPGALAELVTDLKNHGLNINTLHIIERQNGRATVSIATQDNKRARAAVKHGNVI